MRGAGAGHGADHAGVVHGCCHITAGTKIEMGIQSCSTSWDTKIASVRGLCTSRRTKVRASAQNFRASWVTKIAVGVRSLYTSRHM